MLRLLEIGQKAFFVMIVAVYHNGECVCRFSDV